MNIVAYIQKHPKASQDELAKVVAEQLELFRQQVEKLWKKWCFSHTADTVDTTVCKHSGYHWLPVYFKKYCSVQSQYFVVTVLVMYVFISAIVISLLDICIFCLLSCQLLDNSVTLSAAMNHVCFLSYL